MYDSRSELIKAIVKEIRNPATEIIKDSHRYILNCNSQTDIKSIEIADYAGHYCIVVHYETISKEESYTVEKGISTSKGAYSWQGISLTPRSPAYERFKKILEGMYDDRRKR